MRRPEVRAGDFDRPVSTPDFKSKSQLYAAMPRDVLITVRGGDEAHYFKTINGVRLVSLASLIRMICIHTRHTVRTGTTTPVVHTII